MAAESNYAEDTTYLSTRPRIREEVREEVREELRLLEMARPAPEEKLRLEREALQGAVGEVELFEKSWRKSASETLFDIERKVDALGTEARPAAPATRSAPAPTPRAPSRRPVLSEGEEGEEPAWEPVERGLPEPLSAKLTAAEQQAIAAHLGGALQRVDVLFSTSRGRVCEVTFTKGDDRKHVTLLRITEHGDIHTVDEIGAKLDAMDVTVAAPSEAAERLADAPPQPATAPAPALGDELELAIEGIGPAYGSKLRGEGIATVAAFVARDPAEVARATGISPELVRKWHAMAKLQAVKGIGPQYSELLVRAGVWTVADLAASEPDALAKKITDYEGALETRVTGATITPGLVKNWIDEARATAPAPAAVDEDEAPEAAPKARKGFGLKLAKKPKAEASPAAPAPAPAAETAEPKKKFGLSFGKKKEAEAPGAPSEAPAEPAGEGEPAKKKFGLKFGRKG